MQTRIYWFNYWDVYTSERNENQIQNSAAHVADAVGQHLVNVSLRDLQHVAGDGIQCTGHSFQYVLHRGMRGCVYTAHRINHRLKLRIDVQSLRNCNRLT